MAWGAPRGIDDIIARVRANDASLTSLYLMRQRRFELADANDLCDALVKNTVLHDLNISSHAVSPEIAAAFASLLASTATLKSLDLGNASFGDEVRLQEEFTILH
jgi:Ran GTPase-activating protein (RanGAP) involved in mRNA processing and transport